MMKKALLIMVTALTASCASMRRPLSVREQAEEELRNTVIDEAVFCEADLHDVFGYFAQATYARGVVLQMDLLLPPDCPPFSGHSRNITALALLNLICHDGNLSWDVRTSANATLRRRQADGSIRFMATPPWTFVVRPDEKGLGPRSAARVGAGTRRTARRALRSLEGITIPKIECREATVDDTLSFLFRQRLPQGVRPLMSGLTNVDRRSLPLLTYVAENISLTDALTTVCDKAGLEWTLRVLEWGDLRVAILIRPQRKKNAEQTDAPPKR